MIIFFFNKFFFKDEIVKIKELIIIKIKKKLNFDISIFAAINASNKEVTNETIKLFE